MVAEEEELSHGELSEEEEERLEFVMKFEEF